VRAAGRSKEKALWASWGGAPTTQMLRFRDSANRVTVQRRHNQLARLFPDLDLPDEATELADPALADQHYETATRALIERTRDKAKFDRVFDELCQYGFRRNLWGCRLLGLWLAGAGLFLTSVLALLVVARVTNISALGLSASGLVDIGLLLALLIIVRPEWVRDSADAYAHALLASLETLSPNDPAPDKSAKDKK
jgi:hypothetical protein